METRSLGIQCQSRKSTGVQTKRLSKEELRYYTKIVDKEKQVLLNFIKATKEFPPLRQPHYTVNLSPIQTKPRKNSARKKHSKSKNSKQKVKENRNDENSGHYVSKIVVDDATHCLKLSVRSCNPKKSQELKEVQPERARSRKAKQPRRYINRSLEETLPAENGLDLGEENKSPKLNVASPKQQPEILTTMNGEEMNTNVLLSHPMNPTTAVKNEVENTGCLFANTESRDSSPNHLQKMTSQLAPLPDENSERHSTTDDDDSSYHSRNEDSEDNHSVCSEEFFIVEPTEEIPDDSKESEKINNVVDNTYTEKTESLKNELKKRLQANLIRKGHYEDESNTPENNKARDKSDLADIENNMEENEGTLAGKSNNMKESQGNILGDQSSLARNGAGALPQVVSVHFYDPQTHSQRVVDPNTPVPKCHTITSTILPYPKTLSATLPYPPRSPNTTLPYSRSSTTTLPYPKAISATPPYPSSSPTTLPFPDSTSATPPYPRIPSQKTASPNLTISRSMPPNLLQVPLQAVPPMNYPYPPWYPKTSEIPRPSYEISSREVASPNVNRPQHPASHSNSVASRGVAPSSQQVVNNRISVREVSTSSQPTEQRSPHPEIATDKPPSQRQPASSPTETEEQVKIDKQKRKRKRFIFGAHEPPKKRVISSLLTPLCEREATRLADGIHEINMQYFPLRSLAQKAANCVSEDTDDVLKLIDQKIQLKTKIQDVEKARNLLKDIYDMVLKSKEIEDIQNFELVSHNFGVRNILNHLSLVDLYFGELGTELQSKI